MSLAQLFLQLGIAGAVLLVGWRIFDKVIDKWAAAEAERTKAIGFGFVAITTRIDENGRQIDDLGKQLVKLTATFDEHLSTKEAIRQALDEVTGQHELAPLPSDDRDLDLAPPRPFAKARSGTKGGT